MAPSTTFTLAPLPFVDDVIAPVAGDPDATRRYLALIAAATDRLMGADDPALMIEALFELIRDELRLDLFFNFRRDGDVVQLEACGGLTPGRAARRHGARHRELAVRPGDARAAGAASGGYPAIR
ncbi:MAG: hypothetical protein ACK4TC_13345 [Sphingomonas pseudosanguinis]|uniref:hypothetical protein n=1 Tax=Sphingomonas pseudosanguinis TaxID=413712 RepID=UPI00391D9EB1